jgi:hypothetical protein
MAAVLVSILLDMDGSPLCGFTSGRFFFVSVEGWAL